MRCIAEAYLDHTPLLVPEHGFKTNVIAYAKRDIGKWKRLDGLGGYDCYGLIENSEEYNDGLPVCLSEYARLKHNIKKDGRIRLEDVIFENLRPIEIYRKAMCL
jgi:predicted homoserine dehydrogenase-like protein